MERFRMDDIFWLLILIYVPPCTSAIEAISHPEPTTVTPGDTVVFNCTALEPFDEDNILEWYIHWDSYALLKANAQSTGMLTSDDYGPDAGRGNYTTKYQVTTNADGSKVHHCTLTVTNITLKDAGFFGCTHRVDPNNNFRTLLAEKVKLTVVIPPDDDYPHCEQSDDVGSNFTALTCSSFGGNPPATLVWYNGNNEIISQYQNHSAVYYKSINEIVRRYACIATHPGYQQPKLCVITFDLPSTEESTTLLQTNIEFSTQDGISPTADPLTSKIVLPPVNKTLERNYVTPVIIGSSVFGLFILMLILVLLPLFCRREKKKKRKPSNIQEPEIVISDRSIQELPALENAVPQAVEENPYAELGKLPTSKVAPPSHDYEDAVLKPWKYNPELLDSVEDNGGYLNDEQDLNSLSEGASGYTPPSSDVVNTSHDESGLGNIYATRL